MDLINQRIIKHGYKICAFSDAIARKYDAETALASAPVSNLHGCVSGGKIAVWESNASSVMLIFSFPLIQRLVFHSVTIINETQDDGSLVVARTGFTAEYQAVDRCPAPMSSLQNGLCFQSAASVAVLPVRSLCVTCNLMEWIWDRTHVMFRHFGSKKQQMFEGC